MSLVQYKKLWPKAELNHTDVKLSTYTGESIPVEGERDVTVTYQNGNPMVLPITVVRNSNRCKPLLGRNWLKHIKLDWNSIFKINYSDVKISTLLDKYPELSSPGLGCAKTEAKLEIDDSVKPKFCKPRPVPLALKELVEAELDRQVEIGVLKPCKTSDWAAPMVTVLKADQKSVRLCGSYDLTVNKASRLEQYPLPKVDELLTKFAGGEKFSVIDLKEAYLQIPLAEESQKCTVVNTHKGLFTTNRLVYGISSAPAIFQRYLETLLGDIAGVGGFQDDIGVTGSSDKEHIARLEEVFKRLTNEGLKINPNKCKWMVSEITYLGYRINKLGVQPTEDNLPFILETDHKPRLGLLGKNKPLPDAAPPRMIRWKVLLDGYQYELVYVPGKNQANSDALSRLPLPDKPDYIPPCGDVVNLLEAVDSTLVKVDAIQSWTRRDANGVKHLFSPPRHPASNGQAESMVKQVKLGLKKQAPASLSVSLVRWLFKYRTTPHTTTGQTPSELLFRRKIRTHLDLIAPSSRLKKSAENVPSGIIRTFHIDDPVFITEVIGSRFKWLPATVTEVMGQMCRVRLNDGRIFRRHLDHIRHRFSADDVMVREGNQDFRMSERIPAAIPTGIPDVDVGDRNSTPTSTATEETDESQNDRDNVDPVPNFPESSSNSNIPYKTRSGRISKPPEKLSL
ncbi:uncharacterized protein LOC144425109 [Styela clava]